MSYANLPGVTIGEVDKSIVASSAVGNIKIASALALDWGPMTPFEVNSTSDLLAKATPDGKPTASLVDWHAANYMVSRGAPLIIQRVCGASAKAAGLRVVDSGAAGSNAVIAGGLDWASPTITWGADDLLAIVMWPGANGNKFKLKVTNVVSAAYTFDVQIYVVLPNGSTILKNTVTLSRKHINDGSGNALYYDEVIERYGLPFKIVENPGKADTVVPKASSTEVTMANGANGSTVSASDIVAGYTALAASGKEFKFLLALGWTDNTVAVKIQTLSDTMVGVKGVVDVPNAVVGTVTTWRTTFAASDNRVMMVGEWIKVRDEWNSMFINLPPSAVVGYLLAKNRTVSNAYKPFAGLRRGTFQCEGLVNNYSESDCDTLLGAQVNVLSKIGGAYCLLDILTSVSTKSALSNMNIRILFDDIGASLKSYLMGFLQEPNTADLRETITDGVNNLVQQYVRRGDLVEAGVQCDGTNNPEIVVDQETLVIDIFLKPPKAAKFIQVSLVAVGSTVKISELMAA